MQIQELIVENFDKFIEYFNLELRLYGNRKCYTGRCPIHDGDNPTALAFYIYGHTTVGSWRCFTQACHEKYGDNSVGFISALLHKKFKEEFSYSKTIKWCENFLNTKSVKVEKTDDGELTKLINRHQNITFNVDTGIKLTTKEFIERLKTPAEYYINRDYKEETLSKFSVGLCDSPGKPFYNRVVVPLYDVENKYIIGAMGRTIYEQCPLCKGYHKPGLCLKFGKWINTPNLPSELLLYNFGAAKEFINKTGIAIIVEGSPNVWRLHEAGFPMVVSACGSKFTEFQKRLLDTTSAETVVVVPDADEPGKIMVKHIEEQCKHTHNIVIIKPTYDDDIGKCKTDIVKQIIGPVIEKRLC